MINHPQSVPSTGMTPATPGFIHLESSPDTSHAPTMSLISPSCQATVDLIPYFFLKKPVLFSHLGTFSHHMVPNGSLDMCVCVCAKDDTHICVRMCVCVLCLRVIQCSTEILYCFVCRLRVYCCSVIDNIVKLLTQILSDRVSISVDVPRLTRFDEVEVGLMIFVQIFYQNTPLHSN